MMIQSSILPLIAAFVNNVESWMELVIIEKLMRYQVYFSRTLSFTLFKDLERFEILV